ncbi:MAG: hypothetical protein WCQ97_09880 [Aminobacterium sp.]|jgi:flagellar protein FlgJ|uniref:hypothetical protein n=1 Tax=unclassified Aminobacterium TaxID=2685012 RepID=UPI0027DBE504|nr:MULTISPECIES: hypothetical protein [unclassified Aminobacterium]MDD2207374.1 hypothetical protein [Aminobacterium sp.]MDD3426012.1 hypothetical protein [Aminobacterium sp.]MDD3708530.1 hypothetical protein [Aminobacterium sp.]MDD4229447.1 hypothetical protein [Aminobacterium sp.]MDD4552099.1 hypothetical protein [Aminobacterium sp.]
MNKIDTTMQSISLLQETGHRTEQKKQLEEACRQFEGILLGQLWKNMLHDAEEVAGKKQKRTFGPLEDLSVEMSAEALTKQNGVGLWRVLYDQLSASLDTNSSDNESA